MKYEASKTDRITGQEIIDFIKDNHLEDKVAYRTHADNTCMRVYALEYEEDGSTFLID